VLLEVLLLALAQLLVGRRLDADEVVVGPAGVRAPARRA
jgi:hypothetical protein